MVKTSAFVRIGARWFLGLGLGCFVWSAVAADERSPNVVLILTDNQSYYELGCHGHPHVRTPRIDAFAREGVDFVNFHAPPFCSPSRTALLTGRYAVRSGIHNTIGGVSIMHRDSVTVADHLREAGYRTAIFGKWHLGFSHPYHPRLRGFDETFVHGGGGIGQLEDYYGNDHIDATFDDGSTMVPTQGFTSDVLFSRAGEFIERNQDRPFFCFISTPATHRPWQAHPEAADAIRARGESYARNDMALYSMIENIDENVGRVLDSLSALGLADNTLVIVATDQGTRRARHHKGLGYDEYHRVFCMMRYPKSAETAGRAVDALTGMVDVFPTILDVCGVDQPDQLDGRSLVPLLEGADRWADDRHLIVQCPRGRERKKWHNVSVKTQRWRLVNGEALFDMTDDPEQLSDVKDAFPEVSERLSGWYERFWQSLPPAEALLSRHDLGIPDVGETRLNAMDWYQGGAPWHQLHMPKFKGNGKWAVTVAQAGRYRFELRHHPREAPEALGATRALVAVGDRTATTTLTAADSAAVVELVLPAGDFDLQATFEPAPGSVRTEPWGALFVYAQRLDG